MSLTVLMFMIGLVSGFSQSQAPTATSVLDTSNTSFKYEVKRAINRGLEYLASAQNEEGWWSTKDHPALTALALSAFMGHPDERYKDLPENLRSGYQFLVDSVQEDGRIFREGMANYNTALATMAFSLSGDPNYNSYVVRARKRLIESQVDMGLPDILDTPFDGGVGYNDKFEHSDLNNTLVALETLYYTQQQQQQNLQSVSEVSEPEATLDWKAALNFIQHCQNLPSHNDEPWVSKAAEDRGGFVYLPGESKAGERTDPETGRVALRSYGSISYAGLLSYIYADLDPKDPRVSAALNWLKQNFTLEENPGMGLEGYYYYLHLMAKALGTLKINHLVMEDGSIVDWRKDLADRLINLQQVEGSWINTNGRWWERDPVLVTAYAVMTLEIIYRRL